MNGLDDSVTAPRRACGDIQTAVSMTGEASVLLVKAQRNTTRDGYFLAVTFLSRIEKTIPAVVLGGDFRFAAEYQ